jgi:hypothetical protein
MVLIYCHRDARNCFKKILFAVVDATRLRHVLEKLLLSAFSNWIRSPWRLFLRQFCFLTSTSFDCLQALDADWGQNNIYLMYAASSVMDYTIPSSNRLFVLQLCLRHSYDLPVRPIWWFHVLLQFVTSQHWAMVEHELTSIRNWCELMRHQMRYSTWWWTWLNGVRSRTSRGSQLFKQWLPLTHYDSVNR